ncbi:MAG: guanylate kinase [Lachnospiraceae bacterium]|nr:guanylate kinase [Lachnospiraceae bacterium]MBR5766425.1 guanylate kinase [Lachnospiraceae bacterium]MBR6485822.1 guanylate kinase [Lachnospiraceae bacterium]
MEKGILFIISGFAGSGKGTIVKELLKRYDNYALSVSATTRAPRPGEEHGRDYYFVTHDEFEKMIDSGGLLEYAEYVGNYYGTPCSYVDEKLAEGKDVILEIEQQGALQIKRKRPDALLMFVMPPSVQEVYNRLKKRGTETEEVILKRMRQGAKEAEVIDEYDFLIINDELDKCVEDVHNTIMCSRMATIRNRGRIEEVKIGFKEFLKDKD